MIASKNALCRNDSSDARTGRIISLKKLYKIKFLDICVCCIVLKEAKLPTKYEKSTVNGFLKESSKELLRR